MKGTSIGARGKAASISLAAASAVLALLWAAGPAAAQENRKHYLLAAPLIACEDLPAISGASSSEAAHGALSPAGFFALWKNAEANLCFALSAPMPAPMAATLEWEAAGWIDADAFSRLSIGRKMTVLALFCENGRCSQSPSRNYALTMCLKSGGNATPNGDAALSVVLSAGGWRNIVYQPKSYVFGLKPLSDEGWLDRHVVPANGALLTIDGKRSDLIQAAFSVSELLNPVEGVYEVCDCSGSSGEKPDHRLFADAAPVGIAHPVALQMEVKMPERKKTVERKKQIIEEKPASVLKPPIPKAEPVEPAPAAAQKAPSGNKEQARKPAPMEKALPLPPPEEPERAMFAASSAGPAEEPKLENKERNDAPEMEDEAPGPPKKTAKQKEKKFAPPVAPKKKPAVQPDPAPKAPAEDKTKTAEALADAGREEAENKNGAGSEQRKIIEAAKIKFPLEGQTVIERKKPQERTQTITRKEKEGSKERESPSKEPARPVGPANAEGGGCPVRIEYNPARLEVEFYDDEYESLKKPGDTVHYFVRFRLVEKDGQKNYSEPALENETCADASGREVLVTKIDRRFEADALGATIHGSLGGTAAYAPCLVIPNSAGDDPATQAKLSGNDDSVVFQCEMLAEKEGVYSMTAAIRTRTFEDGRFVEKKMALHEITTVGMGE